MFDVTSAFSWGNNQEAASGKLTVRILQEFSSFFILAFESILIAYKEPWREHSV